MNRKQGFSLIELMITIAIIGILASVATPAYFDFVRKAKMLDVISLGKGMADKAIFHYIETQTWPDIDDMESLTGVATGAEWANGDTIKFAFYDNRNGNGQVFIRVSANAINASSATWIRLELSDENGAIKKDWCSKTSAQAHPYLPC